MKIITEWIVHVDGTLVMKMTADNKEEANLKAIAILNERFGPDAEFFFDMNDGGATFPAYRSPEPEDEWRKE